MAKVVYMDEVGFNVQYIGHVDLEGLIKDKDAN
jgi:hypothetical protein